MSVALPILFIKEETNMKYDPELAALLAQPWSNNACRGYVIYAMENCGFSPADIPVSYTHLDVYKRQTFSRPPRFCGNSANKKTAPLGAVKIVGANEKLMNGALMVKPVYL